MALSSTSFWVLSRLGVITTLKNDAKASAAAWLEASNLPAENFEKADEVINTLLKQKLGGTAPVNYEVLKCSLISHSDAIRQLSVQK
ncbi:T6SS amidase immunity protein Tai4 family protein [Enterobacter hormaechei]|uniref:T6SS amidase immunity protein Tai4 family protein n=1 Tax=Enterobacter hormaechei TaxID=158836 RepID=UPI003B9841C7